MPQIELAESPSGCPPLCQCNPIMSGGQDGRGENSCLGAILHYQLGPYERSSNVSRQKWNMLNEKHVGIALLIRLSRFLLLTDQQRERERAAFGFGCHINFGPEMGDGRRCSVIGGGISCRWPVAVSRSSPLRCELTSWKEGVRGIQAIIPALYGICYMTIAHHSNQLELILIDGF